MFDLNRPVNCTKSPELDKKHCWHTSLTNNSLEVSPEKMKSRTHFLCCWCGEGYTREFETVFGPPPKHGPFAHHGYF